MGSFKLEHWWIGLVVAGTALLGASGVAQDRVLAAVGFGLLMFGIGEWMNHPLRTRVEGGYGSLWQITGHPRAATLLGSLFSGVGLLLIFGGAARVAIALL